MVSPLANRPRWQQWAGTDDPRAAVERLEERARQRTRGTAAGNSTDMLRTMREVRRASETTVKRTTTITEGVVDGSVY